MRIVGKRASEFSSNALMRMVKEKRVYYHGKWFILAPEMITECRKVITQRYQRYKSQTSSSYGTTIYSEA